MLVEMLAPLKSMAEFPLISLGSGFHLHLQLTAQFSFIIHCRSEGGFFLVKSLLVNLSQEKHAIHTSPFCPKRALEKALFSNFYNVYGRFQMYLNVFVYSKPCLRC